MKKTCTECKERKDAKAFLPSSFTPDKLTDRCRQCCYAEAERNRIAREAKRREAKQKKLDRAEASDATKKCRTCKTTKPVTEFHRNGQSPDRRRHHCKACNTKSRAKKRSELSIAELATAHEKHLANNHAAVRRWQANNPDAVNAKSAVLRALKEGILAKPKCCQVRRCRSRGPLEAHHHDYQNPLCVTWLCRTHHNRLHAGDKLETVVSLPPVLAAIPEPKSTRRAS